LQYRVNAKLAKIQTKKIEKKKKKMKRREPNSRL